MIPIPTTTITIKRFLPDPHDDSPRDPEDPRPPASVIASGIRAHISTSSGRENTDGGSQEVVEFRFDCDPTDVTSQDQMVDERTNEVYEVVWTRQRLEFAAVGLGYVQGGLKKVTGQVF